MKIKTMCKEVINEQEIPRKLIFDGKMLVIQTPLSKTKDVCIPVDNLQECFYDTKTNLISKDKSVIGRALVGTIVAGPLGTIVGGMSGIGQKTKKEKIYYLAIAYVENGIDKIRIFEDYPSSKTYKIANAFKKL